MKRFLLQTCCKPSISLSLLLYLILSCICRNVLYVQVNLYAFFTVLNGKMPVIQSGTGTLAYANYAVCTARVTFPEPFDDVPDIVISPIVPSEGSWNSTRNSITNSTYMIAGKTNEYFDVRSFSIQDDYTSSLIIQFDWMAKL